MSFKKLLIHIDNSESCPKRIAAAVDLAQRVGGTLSGLYVIPNVQYTYLADTAFAASAVDSYLDELRHEAAETEHRFREAAGSVAVQWKELEGEVTECLASAARYADLVIVGQHDAKDAASSPAGMVESVVLLSGQPVLVIPYIGAPASLGQRVLVAWNGTREAARAVRDAMPLLARASAVDVIGIAERGRDAAAVEAAVGALREHLAAHGVESTPHTLTMAELDPGETILSRAADLGSDLLVMGAYGHSRVRELVLGGATRTLLAEMTLPVFMSH